MPEARRRDIRRRREHKDHRRRRVRLVGSAGVLVVASTLVLTAAPGAHAPAEPATLAALTTGDLVGRVRDVASRDGERSPLTEQPRPDADEPTTPPQPEPTPEPQPHPLTPEPAPPPTAQADTGSAMSAEVVTLTNAERDGAGLPGLAVSPCATEQAAARVAVLVAEGRFEHDPLRPVLDACAAGTAGENLSLGYASAQAAVVGWMASQGHRENILRASYTQIGVACEQGSRGWLCAQVFVG